MGESSPLPVHTLAAVALVACSSGARLWVLIPAQQSYNALSGKV